MKTIKRRLTFGINATITRENLSASKRRKWKIIVKRSEVCSSSLIKKLTYLFLASLSSVCLVFRLVNRVYIEAVILNCTSNEDLSRSVRFEAVPRSSFKKLSSSADHSAARPRLPVRLHCVSEGSSLSAGLCDFGGLLMFELAGCPLTPSIVFSCQLFAITARDPILLWLPRFPFKRAIHRGVRSSFHQPSVDLIIVEPLSTCWLANFSRVFSLAPFTYPRC